MRDVPERPRFLTKSLIGFLAFNVITYSLLIAELVINNTQIHSDEDKVILIVLELVPVTASRHWVECTYATNRMPLSMKKAANMWQRLFVVAFP